jgi:hypothetical protein
MDLIWVRKEVNTEKEKKEGGKKEEKNERNE